MLKADFWALDDHELVRFLPDGRTPIEFTRIPRTLVEKTEVGKTFSATRYRPTYYILRMCELWLWHLDARKWFLARFLTVLISIAIFCYLSEYLVGPLNGALLTIAALTPRYWGDTWGRTGPAEQYATLGLALLILGIVIALTQKRRRASFSLRSAAIWAISIGTILTTGSKEIFLPVAFVPLAFLAIPSLRRAHPIRSLALLSFALAYSALIAWTLFFGLRANHGTTAYGAQIGGDYAIATLTRALSIAAPWSAAALLAILASLFLPSARGNPNAFLRSLRLFMLAAIGALALLTWIVFFYAGSWPTYQYSYDFPGLLLAPFSIGLILWFFLQSVAYNIDDTRWRIALAAFATIGLLLFLKQQSFPSRTILSDYANRSHNYQQDLTTIALHAKKCPTIPIIFSVAHPLDGETVFASLQFLRAKSVSNPCFIIGPDLLNIAGTNSHWQGAANELIAMESGSRGFSPNLNLQATVLRVGHSFLVKVNEQAPGFPSSQELQLRWR
jgi:hypothetical protein